MVATKLFPARQIRLSASLVYGASFASFAGLALLVSACGGGSNVASVGSTDPGTSACPAGVGGLPTGCCDSTGVAITPPPAGVTGCSTTTPGTGPIATTGGTGAGSAGGATTDLGTAQNLVGGSPATGITPQYAGATAGQIAPAAAQLAAAVPATAASVLPTTATAGSAGGSGSGSGSGLDDGSMTTAAASDPGNSPTISGATAADAPYVSNGGGAPGGTTASTGKSGFQFGSGFAGPEGTGAADVAFGNGSSVDPMASGDPQDYFTRIGIEDSIFKKVERRYRDTSVKWASVQPTETNGAATRALASVPNGAAK
jgi:hypothetical protein